ncbi:MAG TPA: site-2 protease family protein [Vicinamibacteria bacterium]
MTFRLFGLPVRLSLFFVLIGFLIRPAGAGSVVLTVAWLLVMFVGVLLHELGHALTARAFGQQPGILLHGLGGLTYWMPRGEIGAGRRLLIAAAGPSVGLVLGFACLVLRLLIRAPGTLVDQVLWFAVIVNLGWGAFNLLPLLPMDGGQVLASFLEILGLGKARRVVHGFSLGVGVIAVAVGLYARDVSWIVLGGLLAFSNYMALRPAPPPPPEPPPPPPA